MSEVTTDQNVEETFGTKFMREVSNKTQETGDDGSTADVFDLMIFLANAGSLLAGFTLARKAPIQLGGGAL